VPLRFLEEVSLGMDEYESIRLGFILLCLSGDFEPKLNREIKGCFD